MSVRWRFALALALVPLVLVPLWRWNHIEDPQCGVFLMMSDAHQSRVVAEVERAVAPDEIEDLRRAMVSRCEEADRTGAAGERISRLER